MSFTTIIENLKPVISVASWWLDILDRSRLNAWASYRASIPQSEGHNSTPTDLSILQGTTPFAPPDTEYQIEHSPTVSQFLNASFSDFLRTDVPPEGMQPFVASGDDGKQLEMVDLVSGVYARVWKTDNNQIIISYSGTTGGENMYVNPYQVLGQGLSNAGFISDVVIPAKKDSVKFAQYVVSEAAKQGISENDVFVTGNSLGAFEASYVAQQTGLGGVAFESLGLPHSETAVGDGSNFISTITYGDAIASLATDIEGAQPLVPPYNPEGGDYSHYGQKVLFGDPQNQVALNAFIQERVGPYENIPLVGDIVDGLVVAYLSFTTGYHKPEAIDDYMGVTLNPAHTGKEVTSETNAYTFDVADYSIGQLLFANGARGDYHAPTLPLA